MIHTSDTLRAKLLIVDDQAANVLLLERLLRSAGYSAISTTQNPQEVVDLHRQNRYDLILLDLNMPEMDGFQVMEALQSVEGDGSLPVLVITAQPSEKLRALKAGALDFVTKPFDIAEVLARVQNLLQVRLLNLETQKLYKQVLVEQELSDMLLHNVLPQAIAERLKGRSKLTADHLSQAIVDSYDEVTVLFADIVGFTAFSQDVSPEVLVGVLNDLFTRFDHIAEHRGLEKIKTIGDCYMAAAGLPTVVSDHADRAAHMALDMIEAIQDFNANTQHPLNIRIGISTGAAVAGVIGKSKFLYDLWGDVVNTASRMESHGIAGRIQLSEATRQALRQPFALEHRGLIEVKGKGEMSTWFLKSAKLS
ncbi:adenylate/guanylate cyclase domain-containing protein [Limnohabitans sp. DCL3]|uniref:adenylate/guanylate cyclase domain-containing protein n=1 Tax=Limnohabitans sp. DCL3 TaxID=3374103 RepID=UPI003A889479